MEKKDEEERGIDEMGMIVELDILGEFGLDRQCPTVAPAIERNQIFSPREIYPNLHLTFRESDYRRPATNKQSTAKTCLLC